MYRAGFALEKITERLASGYRGTFVFVSRLWRAMADSVRWFYLELRLLEKQLVGTDCTIFLRPFPCFFCVQRSKDALLRETFDFSLYLPCVILCCAEHFIFLITFFVG